MEETVRNFTINFWPQHPAATGGDLSDKDGLREKLRAANFASMCGSFRYNSNHFPIQDFYLVQAIEREDGSFSTTVQKKIFEDRADRQAAKCPM